MLLLKKAIKFLDEFPAQEFGLRWEPGLEILSQREYRTISNFFSYY